MSELTSLRVLRWGTAGVLVFSAFLAACSGEPVAVADNGGPDPQMTPEGEKDGAAGAAAEEPTANDPAPSGCGAPGMASPCIDSSASQGLLFECGPIKCNAALQYCLVGYGGIQGDNYSCVELPVGCRKNPSCECADAPECGECTVDGQAVTARCAVG